MRELRSLPRGHGGATHVLYTYTDDGVESHRLQLNKSEARRLQGEIDTESAVAAPGPGAVRNHRRSIILARNAGSLNTGRQWIADGWLIDKYSLPPEWEGEAVCYLYE